MIGLHYPPRTSWVDYFSPNRIRCLFKALLEKNVLAVFLHHLNKKGLQNWWWFAPPFTMKFIYRAVFSPPCLWSPFWDEKFLRVDLWSSWPKDVGGLRIQDGRWITSEQNFVIKSISDTKSNGFLIHPNDIYISVYKIYSNYSISWTTDVFLFFAVLSLLNHH